MTATTLEVLPGAVVQVLGRDRVDLLHRLSTNDLRPLQGGSGVVSTLFTTNQGKLLDWTDVLALDDRVLLRTSPGRAASVATWVDKYTIMEDVQSTDASNAYAFVALTGPEAVRLVGLAGLPARGQLQAHEGAVWLAGMGAYGPRLEGLLPAESAPARIAAWQAAGAVLLDEAGRELQRLRAGVPSHAHEFAGEVNPLELRLTQYAVGWNKGCYIGQEVISRLDSYDKVARLLMGWEADVAVAQQASSALKLTQDGRPLGRVTSWAGVPSGGTVGLAVVKRDGAQPGMAQLETGGAPVPVRLVHRAFFDGPSQAG